MRRAGLSSTFRFDKASAGTLLAHRPDRLVKINWKSIGFDVFDYLRWPKKIYRMWNLIPAKNQPRFQANLLEIDLFPCYLRHNLNNK